MKRAIFCPQLLGRIASHPENLFVCHAIAPGIKNPANVLALRLGPRLPLQFRGRPQEPAIYPFQQVTRQSLPALPVEETFCRKQPAAPDAMTQVTGMNPKTNAIAPRASLDCCRVRAETTKS